MGRFLARHAPAASSAGAEHITCSGKEAASAEVRKDQPLCPVHTSVKAQPGTALRDGLKSEALLNGNARLAETGVLSSIACLEHLHFCRV